MRKRITSRENRARNALRPQPHSAAKAQHQLPKRATLMPPGRQVLLSCASQRVGRCDKISQTKKKHNKNNNHHTYHHNHHLNLDKEKRTHLPIKRACSWRSSSSSCCSLSRSPSSSLAQLPSLSPSRTPPRSRQACRRGCRRGRRVLLSDTLSTTVVWVSLSCRPCRSRAWRSSSAWAELSSAWRSLSAPRAPGRV